MDTQIKPYVVLFGDVYYPDRWRDYVGDADTLDEARSLATARAAEEGERAAQFYWWQIVDLRTKQVVEESRP